MTIKPNAVFLGEPVMFEVYDGNAIRRIESLFDIQPALTSLDNAHQAEYVFSTWGMPVLSEARIATHLPRLRAVFYAAGTVQYFARPFLKRGVRIFSAWAANAVPVAEFTVAQILLVNKGVFADIRQAGRTIHAEGRVGNYRTKIGVLGAGMIGKLVIDKLQTTDLDILVYDPFVPDEYLASRGLERADLERIFRDCHVVTNHVANLPATVGMLDYSLFSRMGPRTVFINTGRGAQVVEADLIRALKEEPGRTALLDVTDPEPPPPESELRTLPNVFLTPHVAGSLANERSRMAAYVIGEAEAVLSGSQPRYEVTETMLDTMA